MKHYGVSAFTVYLLRTVGQEHQTAQYAIATSLMAVGLMIPGMVSGLLADGLGYRLFFLVAFLASLPGLLVLRALVVPEEGSRSAG